MARGLRTAVLMAKDSRVLSSGPADLETLDRTGWLLFVYAVGIRSQGGFWYRAAVAGAMMDDVARAARTRAPPPRQRRETTVVGQDGARCIRWSWLMAATLWLRSLSAGRRRQVPLRQRGELSARFCHAAGFRPVPHLSGPLPHRVASPRGGKTRPIRSQDLYLTDITAQNSRISFHQSSQSEWNLITY